LLLSHSNRKRVVADEIRSRRSICPRCVLRPLSRLDGFVRGAWKIEKTSRRRTLVIEPFEKLSQAEIALR
jgi:hypothetical protein